MVSKEILKDSRLKLRERGLLVTLLSLKDDWDFSIRGLAAILPDGRDAIDKSFKKLFFSHEMKLLKPDPEIYLRAIAESGHSVGECLFIDDSQRNVDGALAVGMHAVLYRPGIDDLRNLIMNELQQ